MSNAEKIEIEMTLIQAAQTIPFTENPASWLTSSELQDFVDGMFQLGDYYKFHDTEGFVESIHFHIVASYLRVTRMLLDVLRDPLSVPYHTQAEETLSNLEAAMDNMTTAGFTKMRR